MFNDFAPQIRSDFEAEPYVDSNGTLINSILKLRNTKQEGYICSERMSFGSLVKGTVCSCGGAMNTQATTTNSNFVGYDGFWSSALAYKWAFPDLTSHSFTATYSAENGILRFKGVTKYDTVAELEQNVDFKASNFATNKYCKVTDDGKLLRLIRYKRRNTVLLQFFLTSITNKVNLSDKKFCALSCLFLTS